MQRPPGYDQSGAHYGSFVGGYGGAAALRPTFGESSASDLLPLKGVRQRLNGLAVFQAWLLPSAVFAATMAVLSYPIWREHTVQLVFVLLCLFLVSFALAAKAYAVYKRPSGQPGDQPTWFAYLAVTCLLAWLVAVILGSVNYNARMARNFELGSLGLARNVDPADIPGTRHLDVSRIEFKAGSRIAEELSLGYKDGATYCAAPIVANGTGGARLVSYDYWAVGIDCCNPLPPASFWCGEGDVSDPAVHGGIRWMGDTKNFLLAIQQAEAEYGYEAMHPILFTWSKDPIGYVDGLRTAGLDFMVKSILIFAGIQAVLLMLFLLTWSPSSSSLLDQIMSTTPAGAAGKLGTADETAGWRGEEGAPLARGWG